MNTTVLTPVIEYCKAGWEVHWDDKMNYLEWLQNPKILFGPWVVIVIMIVLLKLYWGRQNHLVKKTEELAKKTDEIDHMVRELNRKMEDLIKAVENKEGMVTNNSQTM